MLEPDAKFFHRGWRNDSGYWLRGGMDLLQAAERTGAMGRGSGMTLAMIERAKASALKAGL